MNLFLQGTWKRLGFGLVFIVWAMVAQGAESDPPKPPTPQAHPPSIIPTPKPALKDPFKDRYRGYQPDFIRKIQEGDKEGGSFRGWMRDEKTMALSSEKGFFTLNQVHEDSRVNALIKAGIRKEEVGAHNEALRIYRELLTRVLDSGPAIHYRVSEYGLFVPAAQYVQRRILNFPKETLAHYRTLYDAEARASFRIAKEKFSLPGLTDIIDKMLATSYGDNALFELGNAELDGGHHLAALDYFSTLREYFRESDCLTSELDLKIAYCKKMLGKRDVAIPEIRSTPESLNPQALKRLKEMVEQASFQPEGQRNLAATRRIAATDDQGLHPPPLDPLGLQAPIWKKTLPRSRRDFWVFSQPVATDQSIIFRHKNIIYSHSMLTGELRWKNDLGGSAVWQSRSSRKYPLEDLLVRNGMIFTPLYKVGPSLVALDQVTGQLKWAYGPVAASSEEEARMRMESAPAWGPQTVFSTYILDNVEGDTHTDSEYGVLAFDAVTGRIKWRARLCRLLPEKFTGGFAKRHRIRIRSFSSPPLYHQGTVYATTNAGIVAAMDAMTGRVKWMMRYPYNPGIHDATRTYGKEFSRTYTDGSWRPHRPMFWFNQRPLLVGDRLYVQPVDTKLLLCIDRASGKVLWSRPKLSPGYSYFMGPMSSGELVLVNSGREVELVDPQNGATTWRFKGLVSEAKAPLMKHFIPGTLGGTKRPNGIHFNRRWFGIAAHPYLTSDDRLFVGSWSDISCYYGHWKYYWPDLFAFNLAGVSLKERKLLSQRRYYNGAFLGYCHYWRYDFSPAMLESLRNLPHKNEKTKQNIKVLEEVVSDSMPVNKNGAFMPFSRLTLQRYGIPFELRFGPREISVVYDREKLQQMLVGKKGPSAEFARGELAIGHSRLNEAARRLKGCLADISSEDLDFRARVKQQLFQVYKRLARSAIRAGEKERELECVRGMSRTVSTLPEQIETLFALAEAHERVGNVKTAAHNLSSVIKTYGHREYPVAAMQNTDPQTVLADAGQVLDLAQEKTGQTFFSKPLDESLRILKKGLPLYLSSVSPLEKTGFVRAGELAAARLMALQKRHADFQKMFEAKAEKELRGRDPEEQRHRLWEFPGSKPAQEILDELFKASAQPASIEDRKILWKLADAARICGLHIPKDLRNIVNAPPPGPPETEFSTPVQEQTITFENPKAITWLALERKGFRNISPQRAFFGGRLKKRLDNQFVVQCLDLKRGKEVWKSKYVRLKGRGNEPGFFEAFVQSDLVAVHGRYDVYALDLKDGTVRWRFQVPFNFEIKHAIQSGDLLLLAGKAETIALYLPTGEVAWQMKEQGDLYAAPYFNKDRFISVRKLPFNVTVRYRGTGNLIGRINMPDLSLHDQHPLLEKGPPGLPVAHHGPLLVVSDGWYYIAVDIPALSIRWKRLIDANDATRQPAMRFALSDRFFAIAKEDYDQKSFYVLSSKTGEILWRTDPPSDKADKSKGPPEPEAQPDRVDTIRPLDTMFFHKDSLFGIEAHAGQGFYFVGRDAQSGRLLFKQEVQGYEGKPEIALLPTPFGKHAVARVRDKQDFELRAFDLKSGQLVHTLKKKGVGAFGVHGRVSATVQNGRLIMLSKDELTYGPSR